MEFGLYSLIIRVFVITERERRLSQEFISLLIVWFTIIELKQLNNTGIRVRHRPQTDKFKQSHV